MNHKWYKSAMTKRNRFVTSISTTVLQTKKSLRTAEVRGASFRPSSFFSELSKCARSGRTHKIRQKNAKNPAKTRTSPPEKQWILPFEFPQKKSLENRSERSRKRRFFLRARKSSRVERAFTKAFINIKITLITSEYFATSV